MEYLEDILSVNNLTLNELKRVAGTQIRPKKGGKYPRQKFIFALLQAGLKLPYIHRPICSSCGVRFTPVVFHQQRCSCCSSRPTPYVDLTPEDTYELGMSWEEANNYLHLPQRYSEDYISGKLTD